MLKFFGFLCVTCGFVVADVGAEKVEDVKKLYAKVVQECMAENPLTTADLEALANKKTTDNVNCNMACAFKKSGMMDEDGNLSVEGVQKSAEKYLADDPELLRKSEMFTDACKSVNDVPVSDGSRGCERASLIYQCSLEKAPNFDLL